MFGFLFSIQKLKSLKIGSLKESCLNLEHSLKYNETSDIDGLDLYFELKILREIIQVEYGTPIDILNYIIRLDSFPNAFIVYGIMLTIFVTLSFGIKKFFKININKILS